MTEIAQRVVPIVVGSELENAKVAEQHRFHVVKRKGLEGALEKYEKSAHYKRMRRISDIFGFEIIDYMVVKDGDEEYDQYRDMYVASFSFAGEGRALSDMLTSLFGTELDVVQKHCTDGEPLELIGTE